MDAEYKQDMLKGFILGNIIKKPRLSNSLTDSLLFYSKFPFTLKTSNLSKNWDGQIYATNNNGWYEWNGQEINSYNAIYVNGTFFQNYVIALYGENNTYLTGDRATNYNDETTRSFVLTGNDIYSYGSVASLFDNTYVQKRDLVLNLQTGCCYGLFENCTSLITAPSLEFMSNNGSRNYKRMFYGCTSLLTPPPIMSGTSYLNYEAFYQAFYGCSSLLFAPKLHYTRTNGSCYKEMFKNCTSLKKPPELSHITSTLSISSCFEEMFSGCINLEKLPELPKNLDYSSCAKMFEGCSKIKISTTQTAEYSYEYKLPDNVKVNSFTDMFTDTSGTFTGTPTANTTYYTSNQVI